MQKGKFDESNYMMQTATELKNDSFWIYFRRYQVYQ